MKNFINLSSRVINKLYISEIIKTPNKYYIYINNHSFSGFTLFGVGLISSNQNILEICEKKDKNDYDIITEFIKKID